MAFRVSHTGTGDRKLTASYTDDDTYEFQPHGILKVTEGITKTYYSPTAWETVTTDNGHKPGTLHKPGSLRPRQPRAPLVG